jgi:flagellar basal body rod protein FlgC
MAAPKSILRTSSFKKAKILPKFIDEELSMFSSVVSNFKPPFMRKGATIAPEFANKDEDEPNDDQRYDRCDMTVDSNQELRDERINMSVTFDEIFKDDVSTGVTFDMDHPLSSMSEEIVEQGLEITVENYVEYEAMKKQNSVEKESHIEEVVEKELEELRKLKRKFDEEKQEHLRKAQLLEEQKQKEFLNTLKIETELVQKLQKRVADVKELARVKKAELAVKTLKKNIEKSKVDRIPIAEKIQERLKPTVDRIAAANTALDLLDLEVAAITARASNKTKKWKSVPVKLSDHTKRMVPPPPVREKLALPYDYNYVEDLDLDPSFSNIERLEYDEPSSSSGSGNTSSNSKHRNHESKYPKVYSRPGYMIKPNRWCLF